MLITRPGTAEGRGKSHCGHEGARRHDTDTVAAQASRIRQRRALLPCADEVL